MKLRTLLFGVAAAALTAVLAAQAQVPGVNTNLATVWNLVYEASTVKPTYSASTGGVVSAASATDVCSLTGSATKTIRVRRVLIAGQSSAVVTEPVAVFKRSTANSGGTAATLTAVPYDSQSSAATAVARYYTANPTTGTAVGVLADIPIGFGNFTTGLGAGVVTVAFGQFGSAAVLRGTSQVITVNLNGETITGGKVSCTFEWTEE